MLASSSTSSTIAVIFQKVLFYLLVLGYSWLNFPLCWHYIRLNHKAGSITLSWFDIYRSQGLKLLMWIVKTCLRKVFHAQHLLWVERKHTVGNYLKTKVKYKSENIFSKWTVLHGIHTQCMPSCNACIVRMYKQNSQDTNRIWVL